MHGSITAAKKIDGCSQKFYKKVGRKLKHEEES